MTGTCQKCFLYLQGPMLIVYYFKINKKMYMYTLPSAMQVSLFKANKRQLVAKLKDL